MQRQAGMTRYCYSPVGPIPWRAQLRSYPEPAIASYSSATDHRIGFLAARGTSRKSCRADFLAGSCTFTMTKELLDAEFTQRTRTFLFSAIGCVVAEMMGCARIRFFENGLMSFNLPIAPQIVGSRATRSTHPRALRQMTDFANHILGHPFEVANPFVWRTKAEVVRLLAQHGQTDLIARSISCTHVWKMGPRAHCGECAQCLHRRLGILAAGLGESDPLKGYDVELLVDDRADGDSRTMALSLISNALQYPRLSESGFINRYAGEVLEAAKTFSDETIEGAVRRTYELHWRYGNEIGKVIADAIRQYAVEIREHTLPPGCLLRAAIMDQRPQAPLGDPFASKSGTADQNKGDTRDFRRTVRIQLALDKGRKQVVIDGLGDVGTSAQFELVSVLAAQYRTDLRGELKPKNYAFVATDTLMEKLGVESELALRKRISEFRKSVYDLALEKWGCR